MAKFVTVPLPAKSAEEKQQQQQKDGSRNNKRAGPTIFPKLSSPGSFSGKSSTNLTATASPSSSVQSPVFVARPKTSGAEIGTRSASRTQQKQQWADFVLNTSPIEVIADDDSYMFPMPQLRRPSTATNSAAASPRIEEPFPFGSTSALKAEDLSNALSSAKLLNDAKRSNDQSAAGSRTGPSMRPTRAYTTNWSAELESPKPKLNRWKSLGGFFGKKRADAEPVESFKSPDLREEHAPEKVSSPLEKEDVHSPQEVQSPISPVGGLLRSLTKRTKQPSEKRPKTREGKIEERAIVSPLNAPLLDVQIPEIKMERYSVMFQEVLPVRSSSLLARRQAAFDKTKLVPGGSITVS
jgi:hypothetical protein